MKAKDFTIALCFVLVGAAGFGVFLHKSDKKDNWVRGKHGDYCYAASEAHGNIEYPQYFETLNKCDKPYHE